MASRLMTTREDRIKFGMYCQRLAERHRLMKQVLVRHFVDFPVDNYYQSGSYQAGKAKHVPKIPDPVLSDQTLAEQTNERPFEKVNLDLQEAFMERFGMLEDQPEEVKFPVLRASHPGGMIFKTQRLGQSRGSRFMGVRHPFCLKDPNAPAPEYSCYYDKNLHHFFDNPQIRRKLVEQGVITDSHFIREPYTAYKEYIRRKKLPYGRNPIPPALPATPRRPANECRDIFADEDIKKFLETKYKIKPELVDELYSGRRKKSMVSPAPTAVQSSEGVRSPSPMLPALRCSTPIKLAGIEKELQEELHHSRINVVVEKRDMLELQKKTKAIEQGMIKEMKFGKNKKQIEIDRWDKRLEKLRTTFDKKKDAIINRLQEIEEDSFSNAIDKKEDIDKLKRRFAAMFIKQRIVERKAKERRQEIEKTADLRNKAWLTKQKVERERQAMIFNKKMYDNQVQQLAEITSEKTAKIAQLQIKCEYYDNNLESIKEKNGQLSDKVKKLQQQKREMKPGTLDALNY